MNKEKIEIKLDPSNMETSPRESLMNEGINPVLAVVLGEVMRLKLREIISDNEDWVGEVEKAGINVFSNYYIRLVKVITKTMGGSFLRNLVILL